MTVRITHRRRASTPRPVVVQEWILGPDLIGLTMTFYLASTRAEAAGLFDRLTELPLPEGAAERHVHVQSIEPWPTSDDVLRERLEEQRVRASAVLAGMQADKASHGPGAAVEGVVIEVAVPEA